MVGHLAAVRRAGEIVSYRDLIFGLARSRWRRWPAPVPGHLPALVIARLFQGIGASAVMGVNTALLRSIYRPIAGPRFRFQFAGSRSGVCGRPTLASMILSVASWPWLFAIMCRWVVVAVFLARKGFLSRRAPRINSTL